MHTIRSLGHDFNEVMNDIVALSTSRSRRLGLFIIHSRPRGRGGYLRLLRTHAEALPQRLKDRHLFNDLHSKMAKCSDVLEERRLQEYPDARDDQEKRAHDACCENRGRDRSQSERREECDKDLKLREL